MTNPAIQNDFSYYRRTLSRMRINNLSVSARVFCVCVCVRDLVETRLIIRELMFQQRANSLGSGVNEQR